MKCKFTLLLALLIGASSLFAQRYTTEIFSEFQVLTNIEYTKNITIITGAPTVDTLRCNIYMPPASDTETARPLVIYAHTGSFLPRGTNGSTTGAKDDYTVVETCTRLAKMGYVAVSFDYRKGWNPLDTTAEKRRRGLINAAYRGIQDFKTLVRFMRKSVNENGNPYGIDPDKIVAWGQGTGGYIAAAAGSLKLEEIYIPKFQDPITGASFIDTMLLGNLEATTAGAINMPNHLGYSSDIQFSYNAGGALGDISWLDPGDAPMIAAHVIKDPFAPFGVDPNTGDVVCEGPVIVPTTQEFVVNVAGSKCIISTANALGINNKIYKDPNTGFQLQFLDGISQQVAGNKFAEPNLLSLWTQSPQSGPWDFWNAAFWSTVPHPSCGAVMPPTCSFHTINSLTNPDMSLEKANRYIDTLVAFFAPRACLALDLDCPGIVSATSEPLLNGINVSLIPNPATSEMVIRTEAEFPMMGISIYDFSGRLVHTVNDLNANSYTLERNGLADGMYVAKIRLREGVISKKLMFN